MKILDKLLLISILMGSGLSFNKIYLYHILLVVITLLSLKSIHKVKYRKEDLILYIFLLYSFIRVFLSENLILGLKNQIYILIGISIYLNMKSLLKKNEKKVLNLIKYVYIFSCFIGIMEVLRLKRWYTSAYNISENSPSAFYGNINNYATVIVMVFPFILLKKNSISKFFILVTSLILLYFCDSRTNIIAIIIEMGFYFIMKLINTRGKNKVLTLFLGIIVSFSLKDKVKDSYELLYALYNSSSILNGSIGTRKTFIVNILNELKNFKVFLFGVGGGNSTIIHQKALATQEIYNSHSFFLEILVEYGIFIFLLLFIYYFNLIFKNYKNYKKTKEKIYLSIVISLIGTAIGVNSMSTVIYFFPFWCILGFVSYYSMKEVKNDKFRFKYNSTSI